MCTCVCILFVVSLKLSVKCVKPILLHVQVDACTCTVYCVCCPSTASCFYTGVASPSVESSPRDTPGRNKVHKRNERGETPLHLACIKGDTAGMVNLLELGADINTTDHAGIHCTCTCILIN